MQTTSTLNLAAQQAVQRVLLDVTSTGQETGIQVAAYLEGKLVVDAVAGLADLATGRPMTGDTLINVWSAGKGVAATVVHALVERGVLGYDQPVARYWSEFGANGKQGVTVAHVLAHAAGVPQLPPQITREQFADVPAMAAWIAQQAPLWEPGTKVGYHAATFGYIVDELVRRATGRPLDTVTRELVTGPLGIADSLAFAVTGDLRGRQAVLDDEPGSEEALAAIPDEAPFLTAGPRQVMPCAEIGNRQDFQEASHAAGVTASARALARLYAALADGGTLDGVRILARETVERATAFQTSEVDQIIGFPFPRSLGFNLGSNGPSLLGGPTGFGYPGAGGNLAYAEPEHRFALAIAKNRMSQAWPATVEAAVREALGVPVGPGFDF